MLKSAIEIDKVIFPSYFDDKDKQSFQFLRKWIENVQSESMDAEASLSNMGKFVKVIIETTEASSKMIKDLKNNVLQNMTLRKPRSTPKKLK